MQQTEWSFNKCLSPDRRLVARSLYSSGRVSQILCPRRRWRGGGGGVAGARRRRGATRSQIGHASSAAADALGGFCARPEHKHRLAHELRSSRRDSDRPSAFFSFSTNLVWNLSSRGAGAACRGLAEPLLRVSTRKEARDGGARQYERERIAGALRCGLSVLARDENAGPSERDSDTFRILPPMPDFSVLSDVFRDREL